MQDSAPPKGLQGCKQADYVSVVFSHNNPAACPLKHVLHTDLPGPSFAALWRQPASTRPSAPAQAKSAILSQAVHTLPKHACFGLDLPREACSQAETQMLLGLGGHMCCTD